MKKIFSIGFVLIIAAGLTACGETQEEKNQKQLLGDGFKILKDIGEMGQNGASGEEIGDKAIDGILGSLKKIRGKNGEKLSDDELDTLRDGMEKGADFVKEMEEQGKSGKSDEEISMGLFEKMAEMQLKHDDDMTDEEREGAEAAMEMFKDGGKKFKEGQQKMLDQAKADMQKAMDEEALLKKEIREKILTKVRPHSKIALTILDGSDLAKQMTAGGSPKIGCDDVISYKTIDEDLTAKQVLEKMLTYADYDGDSGYYNVFQSSNNLKVDELTIDDDFVVTVKLTGELLTGGMCDNPRVAAQIEKTVKQLNPTWIKGVEILINGESLGDFLSEKDDIDTEIEGEDTGVNPIDSFSECEELPDSTVTQGNPRFCTTSYGDTFTYDALVDDPYVYQEPPSEQQSFILTHNGKMWEDLCIDNLGEADTYDELVKIMKEQVLDDEWSFVEYGATTVNIEPVATCPAKYDVSCDYEEKSVSFELHFDSDNPDANDASATEKTGDLKYRAHFSPTSYDTADEKGMIRASCLFQENEVQGISNRLNADGEWK